jgi:hypothetical protein
VACVKFFLIDIDISRNFMECASRNKATCYTDNACKLAILLTNNLPVAVYAMTYTLPLNRLSVDYVSGNFFDVTKCSVEEFRKHFESAGEFREEARGIFGEDFDDAHTFHGSIGCPLLPVDARN